MMPSSMLPAKWSAVQQRVGRWHDPLRLITNEEPAHSGRIVLRTVTVLVAAIMVWAIFGKLDIIVSADGKLVPKTLVKIVQPAEAGVVKALLVNEGDHVAAGQVLVRLDTTLATADKESIANDIQHQTMQERRIAAELANTPMLSKAGDDPVLFAQVQSQFNVHRHAFLDSVDQEKSLLSKAQNEYRSAVKIHEKIKQSLPVFERSANAYKQLEKQGFFSPLATADKQREAIEKAHDLEAQAATVASLKDTIDAQQKRLSQLKNNYDSELEKERANVRERIAQLQPSYDKSLYREGLMALTAPQDGVIKNLSTTTVGAVVQPGAVVMTLVPQNEQLYADVNIKNEDVGFVQTGQKVQIKLSAYPFQKYGMVYGRVLRISADANELGQHQEDEQGMRALAYKARIVLDGQTLTNPQGHALPLTAGMQVISEINQGKRTVLEYFLSPVQKVIQEAARER